jgi:hypothetical protein
MSSFSGSASAGLAASALAHQPTACIALHCIALHCIALHCIALRCVPRARRCTACCALQMASCAAACAGTGPGVERQGQARSKTRRPGPEHTRAAESGARVSIPHGYARRRIGRQRTARDRHPFNGGLVDIIELLPVQLEAQERSLACAKDSRKVSFLPSMRSAFPCVYAIAGAQRRTNRRTAREGLGA